MEILSIKINSNLKINGNLILGHDIVVSYIVVYGIIHLIRSQKLSKKLIYLTLLIRARTYAHQGVRDIGFSENDPYLLSLFVQVPILLLCWWIAMMRI